MRELVVHISRTPLVGSPGRLATFVRQYTKYDAICFSESDYKHPQAGMFMGDSVDLQNGGNSMAMRLLKESLEKASVVHVHNQVSPMLRTMIGGVREYAPVVYQLHSPLREGPLYRARGGDLGVPIAEVLVVGQMHTRFYPYATAVPNIAPEGRQSVRPVETDEVRILYAPAQKRGGRWNGKTSKELDDVLQELSFKPDVDVITPDQLQPSHVLERLRSSCDITIDEIVTGGFHQISIEGLHAGNATVNGADELSIRSMMGWAKERPPFVVTSPKSVRDDLIHLATDREFLRKTKEASRRYADKNLHPAQLVKTYEAVYDRVINRHYR